MEQRSFCPYVCSSSALLYKDRFSNYNGDNYSLLGIDFLIPAIWKGAVYADA